MNKIVEVILKIVFGVIKNIIFIALAGIIVLFLLWLLAEVGTNIL